MEALASAQPIAPGARSRARRNPLGSRASAAKKPARKPAPPRLRPKQAPSRLRTWTRSVVRYTKPVWSRVGSALSIVSPLGWTVILLTAVSWVLAVTVHWLEFAYVTVFLLVILVIALVLSLGRLKLGVRLDVDPRRVTVGDTAATRVEIVNQASTPLLGLSVEIPIGESAARYHLPTVPPGGHCEEVTLIPTSRRAVITVGPVISQRGDPFNVFRRQVAWTPAIELFIHPRIVALESLGSGLLRDLEGQATNDVSTSDLAFHALRPYTPGDDRRFIHWRSSAKLSATAGMDAFLVRQFLDTRRSHIAVIVDVDATSYASQAEFELSISLGASVAVRALTDDLDITVLCGHHAAVRPPRQMALDTFSRAGMETYTLAEETSALVKAASDVSQAIVCTGSRCNVGTLLRTKSMLPQEVRVIALRSDQGASVGLRQAGGMDVITVGMLADLPLALSAEVMA